MRSGDLGTTGVPTSVTGFHDAPSVCTEPGLDIEVDDGDDDDGDIDAAPLPPGTPATQAIAAQAPADALAAFDAISPGSPPGGVDPGAGQLANLTLAPGVYQSASGAFLITGGDLTLDGLGDSNAVWVFQMASSLTVGNTSSPSSVILLNGAQAKNVFWQVGSSADINGIGGGTMVGTIIASSGVTFSAPGVDTVTTLLGRAPGLDGSVMVVDLDFDVPAAMPPGPATGVTLTPSASSPQAAGTAVTFAAAGQGSSDYEYQFWLSTNGGAWAIMQPFGSTATCDLPPGTPAGTHWVTVWVRTNSQAYLDAENMVPYSLE
jgi:hypothetical protein